MLEMIGCLLSTATAGVEHNLSIVSLCLEYVEQNMFLNTLFIWIGLALRTEPGTVSDLSSEH